VTESPQLRAPRACGEPCNLCAELGSSFGNKDVADSCGPDPRLSLDLQMSGRIMENTAGSI